MSLELLCDLYVNLLCQFCVLISELYNNVFLPTPNSGGSQGDTERVCTLNLIVWILSCLAGKFGVVYS